MIQNETKGYDEQPVRDNTARFLTAIVTVALLLSTATLFAVEPTSASLQQDYATSVAPFLKTYCLDCHGQTTQEAKLDLSSYRTSSDAIAAHQTWEIILDRLEAAEMPPEDAEPQPTRKQRQSVIEWIKAARDFEARRNAGDPGPVLARRLSNAEYNYSIRDLTGIDIQPTKTFPVDPANEAGFDNTGESLTMSPALLRKYLAAARQVAEHLVLKPDGIAFAAHPVVTDTDRDKFCVRRIVDFYLRQPTDLADYFFAAWQYRHRDALGKPDASLSTIASEAGVSPKYLSTVWALLTDNTSETSVGPIATLQQMWNELPADHSQIGRVRAGCTEMRDFVVQLRQKLKPGFPNIKVEGSHVGSQPFVLWKNRQYVAHRRSFDAGALQIATASANTESQPAQKQDGENKAAADPDLSVPADREQRKRHEKSFARFCSVFPDAFYISERGRDYVEEKRKQMGERGRLLSAGFHSMMGYFRDDAPLYDMILDEAGQQELDTLWQELDFVASAPMRQYVGFLWFERTDSRYMRDPQFDFARPEDKQSQTEPMIQKLADVYLEKAIASGGGDVELEAIRHYFKEINLQIRWVEQARVAAEPSHLKAVLEFAQGAWRRQLSQSEQDDLITYYQSLRDTDGLSHEEAIHDTLVSVLMSPLFCYRVDLLGVGSGRRPLTDNELASRLSYFLWSSTPDDELLGLAAAGSLQNPGELKKQVQRMLQDDRIRGLATEFAGNWLDFRRFEEHNSVDRSRFPVFTDDLRQAMFEEPIRFFVDAAQQNRPILDFLYADHTFANSILADHYGIPHNDGASSERWFRVDDASQFSRGGLLPMSVFLTKNAPGLRTSPVKRGYWVVRRLLGEHIPAPPPNVPELPQDEAKLGDLTLREALAKHRENQACSGCHERFDSIGLAFESFGPVGERRDRDLGGRPVSTAATFPGGHDGNGFKDLQTYLRKHRQDEFVENLSRKLLSYALGRSLILSDELLVRDLVTRLKADDYRFNSLIQGIVASQQFLTKRGGEHVVME